MNKVILISLLLTAIIISNKAVSQLTLAEGSTAPDFNLNDINGNPQTLYTHLESDKFAIIDFFAVWCGPCWAYHTSGEMKKFYNSYGPSGKNIAKVFFVEGYGSDLNSIKGSGGGSKGNWTYGTPYPIIGTYYPNGQSITTQYAINVYPTCYLVCPDKKTYRVTQFTSNQLYNKMMEKCVFAEVDASVIKISTPYGTICSLDAFNPIITLRNWGTVELNSCNINYKIDEGTVNTFSWSGNLASAGTIEITLPTISSINGNHIFKVYTSNPNGQIDGYAYNDSLASNFVIASNAISIPFSEGFESFTNFPAGWRIDNPNNDAEWQVSSNIAHTGTKSIGFNNCKGNGVENMTGTIDKLLTPTFDFSNIVSPKLSFDVAYSHFTYQNITYGDTLIIYASIDCGNTWSQVYRKGGTMLSTTSTAWTSTSDCWIPTTEQWRTDNINLDLFSGQPKVMFAFENRSCWAGWIYIDNINISGLLDVASYAIDGDFSIYPNPTSENITISASFNYSENLKIIISDIIGKTLLSIDENVVSGNYNKNIDLNNFSSGVYFITLKTSNGVKVKKFVKE